MMMKNEKIKAISVVISLVLVTIVFVPSATADRNWSIEIVPDPAQYVGADSSIEVDSSGHPHISYYDSTNTRLKYAEWTGSSWQITSLDEVCGDSYTSLELYSDNPYISYYDEVNTALKFAYKTGSQWTYETVYSEEDVGYHNCLAIDNTGVPHIVFTDDTSTYRLLYTKKTGGSWTTPQQIDSSSGGGFGETSIDVGTNNLPHVSYFSSQDTLKYATYTGSSWSVQTVDSTTDTGICNSIVLDSNNKPHISYNDYNGYDLNYARKTGSSWELFQDIDSTGSVGMFNSIAVDSSNQLHISYADSTNGALKYAKGTGSSWSVETVDSAPGIVECTSIDVDSSYSPHISYWDRTTGVKDLKYAKKSITTRTITFYTDPTNGGTITLNGNTYSNGQNTQAPDGTYSITANPSNNYIFNHWSSTGGVTVSDPNSQTTTVTIIGDGSLKAWFTVQTNDWTVIAYLCGDDNLGWWVRQCLNFMTTVGSQNGIEIIALIDDAGGGDSRAYHVLHDNQVNIPLNQINPGWGNEVNMGDPQTLISFSTYCIDNYPADHYLIIPQDHGGSWLGCCWDDSGDHLDMHDLQTAFQQISTILSRKVDVVFFNACLMNGVEIAYLLEPYVEYQAGSETISWTSTCDNEYQDILQYMVNNPNVNPQDLATYIINHQSPRDDAASRTQSISSIELDRMQDLIAAVDALAVDLYNKLDDAGYRDQIENARTQSEYTEGPYGGQTERLIDLYDFVYHIQSLVTSPLTQSLAQDILNLIGPAGGQYGNVINRERHTDSASFCHGMSLYFPDRSNRYDGNYLINNNFVSDTNWDEFLGEYINGLTGVGYGWDMIIDAKGGGNGTAYFTFGEDEYATDGYDENLDVEHTNSPTDVEIYSIVDSNEYRIDIKHGPDTSKTWDIYVEWQGSYSETVRLSWDASPIPNEEYPSMVLYDCDNNKQINMLTSSSYSLTMDAGETLHMKIMCSSSENNPPVKPQSPSGPTSVKLGRECTYTAVTIDPDDDTISYIFDWGDGTTYQTDFVPSGQVASATHKWSKKENYQIRVKAVDENNMESDWSDPLAIRVPRYGPSMTILEKLFERFPNAFPILRQLLGV